MFFYYWINTKKLIFFISEQLLHYYYILQYIGTHFKQLSIAWLGGVQDEIKPGRERTLAFFINLYKHSLFCYVYIKGNKVFKEYFFNLINIEIYLMTLELKIWKNVSLLDQEQKNVQISFAQMLKMSAVYLKQQS